MLPFKFKYFAVIFLSLMDFQSIAQLDSTSTITRSEYREDTLFYQEITIQNFLEGKLIYERKQKGIGRDEFEYEVLNNFYDHNGELRESVLVERDGYECPPEVSNGLFSDYQFTLPSSFVFTLPDSAGTKNKLILPDSLPDNYRFCGRYFRKTTQYQRYLHVTNTMFYYDDNEPNYFVDSLFFNRYGDKIREVRYSKGKRINEQVYVFNYDAQGRVVEKIWKNLTTGHEFEQVLRYKYSGDTQLQIYNSNQFLSKGAKRSYSITEYDEENRVIKHQNFEGDSLTNAYVTLYDDKTSGRKQQNFSGDSVTSTYFYIYRDEERGYIGINASGDTINVSRFIQKKTKNGLESWSYQSIRSSDQYQYSIRDSIPMKKGYKIRVERYRISKKQFEEREIANKRKNVLLFKETQTYDSQGRLIREEEFDDHFGEEDIRWEYGG